MDEEKLITNLFKDKNPLLRPAYRQILEEIQKIGDDIKVKPCKTYIPFTRNKQFLIVKPSKVNLKIGLSLPDDFEHAKLEKAKGLGGSNRINFQTTIISRDKIDEDLIELIRQAYEYN